MPKVRKDKDTRTEVNIEKSYDTPENVEYKNIYLDENNKIRKEIEILSKRALALDLYMVHVINNNASLKNQTVTLATAIGGKKYEVSLTFNKAQLLPRWALEMLKEKTFHAISESEKHKADPVSGISHNIEKTTVPTYNITYTCGMEKSMRDIRGEDPKLYRQLMSKYAEGVGIDYDKYIKSAS